MGNFQARYKRLLSSRGFVHGTYRVWIALPYPLRKPATAMAILGLLLMKRLSGVDRLPSRGVLRFALAGC